MTFSFGSCTPADLKKALQEELQRGQESAVLLGVWLQDDLELSHFIGRITESFSRCRFMLDVAASALICSPSLKEVTANKVVPCRRRRDAERCQTKESSRKRPLLSPWHQVTTKSLNDGYKWKKYGQKDIKGFKHPRSYFHCHGLKDEACEAKRYVQQTDDDPSLYLITYHHQHTCKPVASKTLQPSSLEGKSLISFGSSYNNLMSDVLPASSSLPTEVTSNLTIPGCPWSEYTMMLPDQDFLVGADTSHDLVFGSGSNYEDANAGTFEGSSNGMHTVGSVQDFGEPIVGFRASYSSLESLIMADSLEYNTDEAAFQRDSDEVIFPFDEGDFLPPN